MNCLFLVNFGHIWLISSFNLLTFQHVPVNSNKLNDYLEKKRFKYEINGQKKSLWSI